MSIIEIARFTLLTKYAEVDLLKKNMRKHSFHWLIFDLNTLNDKYSLYVLLSNGEYCQKK